MNVGKFLKYHIMATKIPYEERDYKFTFKGLISMVHLALDQDHEERKVKGIECIKILRGLLKQENCRGEVSFAHIERAIKEIGDVKDASYTTYYCPSCGEDNEEKCLEIMSPGPYEWTCKNCDTKWIINIGYYIQ